MVHIGSIFSSEFRMNPFFIVKKGCTDAGCGWRRLCSRVGAASSFFFFSRRIGPYRPKPPSQAVPAPKPTWLSAVRMAVEVFLEPNQASIFSFRFPVSSSVMRSKSKFKCLKFLTSLPRGPSTSITLAFTLIFDPIWDVHGLWWQDGLHFFWLCLSLAAALRKKNGGGGSQIP